MAAYVAKYATKAAEVTGTIDHRIRQPGEIIRANVSHHARAMMTTAWTLGAKPECSHLKLRRWAHMLGYRGHFSTKSRVYSTTLGALRQARADYRLNQQAAPDGSTSSVATESTWAYLGRGYLTAAQDTVAADIRARRRPGRKASECAA